MRLPIEQVRAATFTRLSGASLELPVKDYVEENTPMPYAVVGDVTTRNASTYTTPGHEMTVTVEVYTGGAKSGARGKRAAAEYLDKITQAMTEEAFDLSSDGLSVIMTYDDSGVQHMGELIWWGWVRFRFWVDEENNDG